MGQCLLKDCGFKYEKNQGFKKKEDFYAYLQERIMNKKQLLSNDDIEETTIENPRDSNEETILQQNQSFGNQGQQQVKLGKGKLIQGNQEQFVGNQGQQQQQGKLGKGNNQFGQQNDSQDNNFQNYEEDSTQPQFHRSKFSALRTSQRDTYSQFNQKQHFFNELKGSSPTQLQNYIFEKISPMTYLDEQPEDAQMIFSESDWKEESGAKTNGNSIQKFNNTQHSIEQQQQKLNISLQSSRQSQQNNSQHSIQEQQKQSEQSSKHKSDLSSQYQIESLKQINLINPKLSQSQDQYSRPSRSQVSQEKSSLNQYEIQSQSEGQNSQESQNQVESSYQSQEVSQGSQESMHPQSERLNDSNMGSSHYSQSNQSEK